MTAPRNRAPIGPCTIRAAYSAHRTSTHDGRLVTSCRTCRSYLRGIARAAARAELLAHRGAIPAGYTTGPDGEVEAVVVLDRGDLRALPLRPASPSTQPPETPATDPQAPTTPPEHADNTSTSPPPASSPSPTHPAPHTEHTTPTDHPAPAHESCAHPARRPTMAACPGPATAPAPPATDANTAPNATAT